MPLLLNNDEIESVLTMEVCLEALGVLYRAQGEGGAAATPRADLHLPTEGVHDLPAAHYLKSMSGGVSSLGVAALRFTSDIVTWPVVDGKRRRLKVPSAPGRRWLGLILLFSSATGELLAIMNDGVIQRMRVGGTNGIAAKHLARRDARRVGILGSGWQAGAQLMALCAVRPIEAIRVYSPTAVNRARFAKEMAASLGVDVRPVETPEAALEDADVAVAATNTREPILRGEWLEPGVHLSVIQRDEPDAAALARCQPLVVHAHEMEIHAVSADLGRRFAAAGFALRDHPASPAVDWTRLPTLADLVTGKVPGRTDDRQITGFVNNIGLGTQFAAVGARVVERARARGLGRELPLDWFLQNVHP